MSTHTGGWLAAGKMKPATWALRILHPFTLSPPSFGLTGTKSCNLIPTVETKDPFSIPSFKEALQGAPGSLLPPVNTAHTPQFSLEKITSDHTQLYTGYPVTSQLLQHQTLRACFQDQTQCKWWADDGRTEGCVAECSVGRSGAEEGQLSESAGEQALTSLLCSIGTSGSTAIS